MPLYKSSIPEFRWETWTSSSKTTLSLGFLRWLCTYSPSPLLSKELLHFGFRHRPFLLCVFMKKSYLVLHLLNILRLFLLQIFLQNIIFQLNDFLSTYFLIDDGWYDVNVTLIFFCSASKSAFLLFSHAPIEDSFCWALFKFTSWKWNQLKIKFCIFFWVVFLLVLCFWFLAFFPCLICASFFSIETLARTTSEEVID